MFASAAETLASLINPPAPNSENTALPTTVELAERVPKPMDRAPAPVETNFCVCPPEMVNDSEPVPAGVPVESTNEILNGAPVEAVNVMLTEAADVPDGAGFVT